MCNGHYYRDSYGRNICIDDKWYIFDATSIDEYTIIHEFYVIKRHKKYYISVDESLKRKKQIEYISELIERRIEELIFNKI
jgi:hypothetical protein